MDLRWQFHIHKIQNHTCQSFSLHQKRNTFYLSTIFLFIYIQTTAPYGVHAFYSTQNTLFKLFAKYYFFRSSVSKENIKKTGKLTYILLYRWDQKSIVIPPVHVRHTKQCTFSHFLLFSIHTARVAFILTYHSVYLDVCVLFNIFFQIVWRLSLFWVKYFCICQFSYENTIRLAFIYCSNK